MPLNRGPWFKIRRTVTLVTAVPTPHQRLVTCTLDKHAPPAFKSLIKSWSPAEDGAAAKVPDRAFRTLFHEPAPCWPPSCAAGGTHGNGEKGHVCSVPFTPSPKSQRPVEWKEVAGRAHSCPLDPGGPCWHPRELWGEAVCPAWRDPLHFLLQKLRALRLK